MIDEHQQDLASAYALDALDAASARAFEADMAANPELRALTDDLREAAAAMASTAPRQLPPPEVRERILSVIRAEASIREMTATAAANENPTKQPAQSSSVPSILPWALAAGFALTSGALWFERDQIRTDSEGLRKEAIELRDRDATAKGQIAALKKEVTELQGRDVLAQVRIATLTAKVEEFAKSSAIIAWDPVTKRGIVKLANLPRPEAGKDYQLWIVDPKYPQPVSGGIVPVDQNGSANVSFAGDQPIEKVNAFAISVEPTGGVPKATGPIVLIGN